MNGVFTIGLMKICSLLMELCIKVPHLELHSVTLLFSTPIYSGVTAQTAEMKMLLKKICKLLAYTSK